MSEENQTKDLETNIRVMVTDHCICCDEKRIHNYIGKQETTKSGEFYYYFNCEKCDNTKSYRLEKLLP